LAAERAQAGNAGGSPSQTANADRIGRCLAAVGGEEAYLPTSTTFEAAEKQFAHLARIDAAIWDEACMFRAKAGEPPPTDDLSTISQRISKLRELRLALEVAKEDGNASLGPKGGRTCPAL